MKNSIEKMAEALNIITENIDNAAKTINKTIHEYVGAMLFIQEVIQNKVSPCGICENKQFCKEENKKEKRLCVEFTLKEKE